MLLWIFRVGFCRKFIVFSFSVWRVILELVWVSEEIISIGIGCSCISCLRKFRLFMCGIFMFRVSIFGLCCLIRLWVIRGFGVIVIIFILLWLLMILFIRL